MKGILKRAIPLDRGYANILNDALDHWTTYKSTGYILDYNPLMTEADSATYNKINTYVNDYMSQAVPEMIKNGLDGWDNYTITLNKYGPAQVTNVYQELIKQ